jgi:biopolymer transport protein ExbB
VTEAATRVPAETAAAPAAADAPETLLEYFLAGGPLMWVILACSVVGLAFVIERCVNLRRSKNLDDATYRRIMELVEQQDAQMARAHARENPGPMSRVLASVLSCARSPRAEMETMLEDAGARELWQLRRNSKPLGIIASVAPLLGLLGTVLGIIRAFRDVAMQEGAIGNPKMLANGIYEALITTAAGLTVAIPMLLFYHYFRGKAEDLVREIEEKSLQLIAHIMHLRGDEAAAPETGGTRR